MVPWSGVNLNLPEARSASNEKTETETSEDFVGRLLSRMGLTSLVCLNTYIIISYNPNGSHDEGLRVQGELNKNIDPYYKNLTTPHHPNRSIRHPQKTHTDESIESQSVGRPWSKLALAMHQAEIKFNVALVQQLHLTTIREERMSLAKRKFLYDSLI